MRHCGAPTAALALLILAAGCQGADPIGTACPALGPGSLPGLSWIPDVALDTPSTTPDLAAGHLAAHAVWLPEGATIDVHASVSGSAASAFVYGPRTLYGGVPFCLTSHAGESADAQLNLEAAEAGEYLIVAGPYPAAAGGELSVTISCTDGCPADLVPCPTLTDLGCAGVRCDGELARDADGCLTCECQTGHVCGPERSTGPGGTCVLPACDCSLAQAVEVCGADGQTWPSACAARCAGIPVALTGPCSAGCPNLASCDTPCWGLRKMDASSGCPTCDCAELWPATAEDCAACSLDESPVCGADGVTYRNRCMARCAGTKLLYATACAEGCTQMPVGCDLDCAYGLRFGDECVICDCADTPPDDCEDAGDTTCAVFDSLSAATTVGSPCLALTLGATDGTMGPCGIPCETTATCPIGSTCRDDGSLAGRCVGIGNQAGGCSSLIDYVCGDNGETYPNSCISRWYGALEAHRGKCCDGVSPINCEGDTTPPISLGGCALTTGTCQPATAACLDEVAPVPEACSVDGERYTSACEAHRLGVQASHQWCAP